MFIKNDGNKKIGANFLVAVVTHLTRPHVRPHLLAQLDAQLAVGAVRALVARPDDVVVRQKPVYVPFVPVCGGRVGVRVDELVNEPAPSSTG